MFCPALAASLLLLARLDTEAWCKHAWRGGGFEEHYVFQDSQPRERPNRPRAGDVGCMRRPDYTESQRLAVTNSAISILHILAPCHAGGLESVVQTLAEGHHRRGHTVQVAAVVEPAPGEHPFVSPLRSAGVQVRVLELPAKAYFTERRLVRGIFQHLKPDVVHTHGYRPDVLHVGIARRCGFPVVTTLHGASRTAGRSSISEWLQLMSMRRFDAVVAVSQRIAAQLQKQRVPADRVHLIPNAWNGVGPCLDRAGARRSLGIPGDATVVGWAGRLVHAKGADVFIRAMAKLNDLGTTISILGDGRELEATRNLTSSLQLDGRVIFHGTVQNARDFLPAFDLLVLSSRTEGTPIVLFEAMAAGVPIVAAAVGGVPDVLRAKTDALLVAPDDPEALAAAIRSALEDRTTAMTRAREARTHLGSHFSTEPWLDRYERLYRALIASARASRQY